MSGIRKILSKAELEVEIMSRLRAEPECAGIVHVGVKPSGLHPPQPTWMIAAMERNPGRAYTRKSNTFMYSVVNAMRAEFDLLPE